MARSEDEKKLVLKMMNLNITPLTFKKWEKFKDGIEQLYRNRQNQPIYKRRCSQFFICLEKCKIDNNINLKLFSEYQKEILHVSENQIVASLGTSIPFFIKPGLSYYKKINKDSGTIWTSTLAKKLDKCLSFIEKNADTDSDDNLIWCGVPVDELYSFPANDNMRKNLKYDYEGLYGINYEDDYYRIYKKNYKKSINRNFLSMSKKISKKNLRYDYNDPYEYDYYDDYKRNYQKPINPNSLSMNKKISKKNLKDVYDDPYENDYYADYKENYQKLDNPNSLAMSKKKLRKRLNSKKAKKNLKKTKTRKSSR